MAKFKLNKWPKYPPKQNPGLSCTANPGLSYTATGFLRGGTTDEFSWLYLKKLFCLSFNSNT